MTRLHAFTLAAAIAFASGSVLATDSTSMPKPMGDHGQMKGQKMMEMMDTDKDGMLSHDEMAARGQEHFKQADTNGDGAIDKAEWKVMHDKKQAEKMEMRFDKLDTNGDGKITQEEMTKRGNEHFEKCDADKDGKLNESERKTCRDQMKDKMQKQSAKEQKKADKAVDKASKIAPVTTP